MAEEKALATDVAKVEVVEEKVETLPKTYTEEEYKGLQRKLNQLSQELQSVRGNTALTQSLKDEIAAMREDNTLVLEYLKRKPTENYATEPESSDSISKAISDLQKKREEKLTQEKQKQELVQTYSEEIREVVTEAGLDVNDELLANARRLWDSGDYKGAARESRAVAIKTLKGKTAEVNAKDEEIKAKQILAKGDTGGPTTSRTSKDDDLAAYIRGDKSRDDVAKYL